MTHAVTTTTVRLVRTFTGKEGGEDWQENTHNRVYQTLDGHTYVTSSWSPTQGDCEENTMAWEAQDEGGLPSSSYVLRMLLSETEFYVDGPDTDENHEAALAQQGYYVERQEEAA